MSGYEMVTPDEAARIMRSCVGLTKPQALANAKYRESVKQAFLKANPRMRQNTAEKRASEAAARYAARQHRYRAQNIARTELVFAYNAGAYGATKDAQARGYIGDCVKVWLTDYDERVCPVCSAMDGEKRNMDAAFSNGKLLPPAHPSCRCAVAFEEIPGTGLNHGGDGGIVKTTFESSELLTRHYEKHQHEFGDISESEYLELANRFLHEDLSKDVEQLARSDGSISKYKFSTSEFLVINKNGTIRTYFKPALGAEYWRNEHERNQLPML